MKKLLTLILAGTCAAAALTACTPKTNDTAEGVVDPADGITIDEAEIKINELAAQEENDVASVATVGDYNVTVNEYNYMFTVMNMQYSNYGLFTWPDNEEDAANFYQAVEGNIKTDAALFALCREKGITLTEEEFNSEVVEMYDSIVEDTSEDFYVEYGVSKHFVYESLVINAYFNKLTVNHIMENKDSYAHAKHILIQFPTNEDGSEITEEQKAETLARAEEVLAKVDAGEDFDALIAEYGEDPGMQSNPDGYYFGTGEMVPEFEEAAFALEEGAHSGIVETTYGYHIILKLPIDEAAIAENDQLLSGAGNAVVEELTAIVETMSMEYVDNYEELTAPIQEKGAEYRDEIAAEYEAYMQSMMTETEDETVEGEAVEDEAAEDEAAEGEEELPEVEVEG